jgi:hypothetical protein
LLPTAIKYLKSALARQRPLVGGWDGKNQRQQMAYFVEKLGSAV